MHPSLPAPRRRPPVGGDGPAAARDGMAGAITPRWRPAGGMPQSCTIPYTVAVERPAADGRSQARRRDRLRRVRDRTDGGSPARYAAPMCGKAFGVRTTLENRRVLVVEDEPLIAMMV